MRANGLTASPNKDLVKEINALKAQLKKLSAAMEAHKSDKWDPEKLNEWLYKPQAFIKGTKMTFAGIPKGQDRADVIAYLETLK